MTTTPKPLSALAEGDVILYRRGTTTATVARLQRVGPGRTRVWVRPAGQRWSQVSPATLGIHNDTDTFDVVVVA